MKLLVFWTRLEVAGSIELFLALKANGKLFTIEGELGFPSTCYLGSGRAYEVAYVEPTHLQLLAKGFQLRELQKSLYPELVWDGLFRNGQWIKQHGTDEVRAALQIIKEHSERSSGAAA